MLIRGALGYRMRTLVQQAIMLLTTVPNDTSGAPLCCDLQYFDWSRYLGSMHNSEWGHIRVQARLYIITLTCTE